MRIVIAPDKFKGSLSAAEVSDHLAAGLSAGLAHAGPPGSGSPAAQVVTAPMADGGEGTLDAVLANGFDRCTHTVSGPLSSPVAASFALRGEHAVIELAAASGLLLVHAPDRLPLSAHTRGTGQLIAHALDAGARHIVLAVGGSASTDGGTGMLAALGARFLDAAGRPLADGGGALSELDRVDFSGLDPRLRGTEIVLATDVDNALCGDRGAARVFAPQKGATPEQVEMLERGLRRLADTVAGVPSAHPRRAQPHGAASVDPALAPGSGAAGGVGFAAIGVLGADRRVGAEVVAEVTGFPELVRGASLVITGEGSFDAQSLSGKTPVGVLRVAERFGVPAVLVCGRNLLTRPETLGAGFAEVYAIADRDPDPRSCMANAASHLEQLGYDIGLRAGMLTKAH